MLNFMSSEEKKNHTEKPAVSSATSHDITPESIKTQETIHKKVDGIIKNAFAEKEMVSFYTKKGDKRMVEHTNREVGEILAQLLVLRPTLTQADLEEISKAIDGSVLLSEQEKEKVGAAYGPFFANPYPSLKDPSYEEKKIKHYNAYVAYENTYDEMETKTLIAKSKIEDLIYKTNNTKLQEVLLNASENKKNERKKFFLVGSMNLNEVLSNEGTKEEYEQTQKVYNEAKNNIVNQSIAIAEQLVVPTKKEEPIQINTATTEKTLSVEEKKKQKIELGMQLATANKRKKEIVAQLEILVKAKEKKLAEAKILAEQKQNAKTQEDEKTKQKEETIKKIQELAAANRKKQLIAQQLEKVKKIIENPVTLSQEPEIIPPAISAQNNENVVKPISPTKPKKGIGSFFRTLERDVRNAVIGIFGVAALATSVQAIKASTSNEDDKKKMEMKIAKPTKEEKRNKEEIAKKQFIENILNPVKDKINMDSYNKLETDSAKERLISFVLDTTHKPEAGNNYELLSLAVKSCEGTGSYTQRNNSNTGSPALGAYQERYLDNVKSQDLDNDNEADRQTFLHNHMLQEEALENRIKVWEADPKHKELASSHQYGLFFAEYFYGPKGIAIYLGKAPDEIPPNNNISCMGYIKKAKDEYNLLRTITSTPGYWIFDDKQEDMPYRDGEYGSLYWVKYDSNTKKFAIASGNNTAVGGNVFVRKYNESNPTGRNRYNVGPIGTNETKQLANRIANTISSETRGDVDYTVEKAKIDSRKAKINQTEESDEKTSVSNKESDDDSVKTSVSTDIGSQMASIQMTDKEKALVSSQSYAKQFKDKLTPEEYKMAMNGTMPNGYVPIALQKKSR